MALRPRRARVARVRYNRVTLGMGVLAFATAGALLAGEIGRVWRRGAAPLPADTDDVLAAVETAARESVAVAVEGYRASPARETALLNMLGSFVLSFATVRASTSVIRTRGTFGPFRNLRLGRRHIHHYVPGIAISLVAGGASIVSRDESLDKWLAIPFGLGAALTLDESALLLELDDVYFTEEGVVSVQIALAAIALLGALGLALRMLQRGEERVLAT